MSLNINSKKAMAPHSSVLAWRIPGMGEPGGLPSMGSHRVRRDWSNLAAAAASIYDFCAQSGLSSYSSRANKAADAPLEAGKEELYDCSGCHRCSTHNPSSLPFHFTWAECQPLALHSVALWFSVLQELIFTICIQTREAWENLNQWWT